MRIIPISNWIVFLMSLIIFISVLNHDNIQDALYDLRHRNPPVTTKAEVDGILSGFQRVRPETSLRGISVRAE